jgi:hypothetical protein
MTASLLELRRVPETCGRRAVVVQARRGWPGSAGLSGWAVPVLSGRVVAAGLAVASQAIGISRRTS